MKKLIPIIAAVSFSHSITFSQACLPEGITFTTQEQIDNFASDYPGCTEIEGNVTISGADISNLNGLSVLTSIGDDLQIKLNEILSALSGLHNLAHLGGDLNIEQNKLLVNLQGLEKLTTLNGDLIIGDIALGQYPYSTGNPSLTSLIGLNNLLAIQGDLKLCGNYTLSSLSGLENLTFIGGNLQVGGIEFVYGFTFGNRLLVNLSGLTRLAAIGGGLFIAGNSNLATLSGLDSLTSIGRQCWFDLNESLFTLQGLNQLKSIGGSLYIRWNSALTDISGLENTAALSIQDLEIIYNRALSECNIQPICNYLANPGGAVTIEENAPGCNNPEEVKEACHLAIEQIGFDDEVLLFPNPAEKTVTISGIEANTIPEIITYNQTGQKVLQGKPVNNTLDVSTLRPGVYLVELMTNQGIVKKKLMVE